MTILEVQNITRYYGDICAVKDISFKVDKGEVVGFLGPNGAGKTTTMKIITGVIGANSGNVRVNGLDILLNLREVKKVIGYMPENPPLYNDMTVSDYLKFTAKIKGVPKKEIATAVEKVERSCGLTEVKDRLIGNLSKGYRQRVGIAQSLVHSPTLLILDEPTIGLDPRQVVEIRSLIGALKGDRTVILSTHILSEVETLCKRVIIVNKGRVVADDSLKSLEERYGDLETAFIKLTSRDDLSKKAGASNG